MTVGEPSVNNALQGDFGEAWLEAVAAGCGFLRGRAMTVDLEKADVELTLCETVGATCNPTVKVQAKTTTRPRTVDDHIVFVLPITEEVTDYAERVIEALRTLSFAERRTSDEIVEDIEYGGVDTVAVKLTPDAPSGQAPLSVAHSAISALKEWVVGSASALDVQTLYCPHAAHCEPRALRARSGSRLQAAALS